MSKTESSDQFINRELSLLQFNARVFALAQKVDIPLLERLRYLFICSANLDEFFEVRVAGLKHQLLYGRQRINADGLSVEDIMNDISVAVHALISDMYQLLNLDLLPALQSEGIHILPPKCWSEAQAEWIKNYFHKEVLPLISPIGLDLAHPFPRLVNKSLNYIVSLTGEDAFNRDSGLAIVNAPRNLMRVLELPSELCEQGDAFVFLNSIIYAHVNELFPGMTVTGCYQFRITRNSDMLVDEDNTDDLASAIKNELFSRRYGTAVRLELDEDCPEHIAEFLLDKHHLNESELYRVNGPVNLNRFRPILNLTKRYDLMFPRFTPGLPDGLTNRQDIFEAIKKSTILLHHPYQSFTPVVDFVRQAAMDMDVLAIKLTLYRVDKKSQMADVLVNAAKSGKQVTVVIELRARFDEARNIEFATRLQEAGALVIYGVIGFKTHAKMILVVRREQGKLQHYAHVGTGNYNAVTARSYTDFGLFTYDKIITSDIHKLFQQLTGMGEVTKLKKLLQSPFTLHKVMLSLIRFETNQAKLGHPARIIAKMNSLTDHATIEALYEASQAGVKIDLIVRGICCLRPKVKGLSETIRVRSVIGRFLEHSRVYYFHHSGEGKTYISSADWMERNLAHRVEIAVPIEDELLKKRIKQESLDCHLRDNTSAWELQKNGCYKAVMPSQSNPAKSSQIFLLDKHC